MKAYRECMAEIIGVLKKYDMAGAITVVCRFRSREGPLNEQANPEHRL